MRKVVVALALLAALSTAPSASYAFNVVNNSFISYVIDGVTNPTLTLTRGQTYTFSISAVGHPFWIKTVPGIGTGNAFSTGVTGNGTQSGTLTFVVPNSAPDPLYYNCEFHGSMTGQLHIVSPVPGASPIGLGALALMLAGASALVMRRRTA